MIDGFHGPWVTIGVRNPDGVIAPVEYGLATKTLFVDIDDREDDWDAIRIPLRRL